MLGSFDLGLEIASFRYQAMAYTRDVRKDVSQHLAKTVRDPLAWMQRRCQEDAQKAQQLFDDLKKGADGQSPELFAAALGEAQDRLDNLVTDLSTGYALHTLQPIEQGRTIAPGKGAFTFSEEVSKRLMHQVGGDCDFWIGEPPVWSAGDPPPDGQTLRVPVRELVRPLIEGDLQPGLDALGQRASDLHGHALSVLQDIWKVIHFNVESGIAEIEGDRTDCGQLLATAEEIVVGGLTRAGARVGELIVEVDTVANEVDSGVQTRMDETVQKVEESLQPGSGLDVRLHRLARLARSRAEGYAEIGEGIGSALLARMERLRKWTQATGQGAYALVRRRLGLTHIDQQEAQTIIDEADLSHTSLERLPSIYRRLFRMEPLQTEDFLVARSEELDTIANALVRWQDKHKGCVALVGAIGTGKTTLLNCATIKVFQGHKVYRHAFDATVNTEAELARILCSVLEVPQTDFVDELVTHLRNRETTCVVLLEHGYELFMRRIGGLDVIRSLLQIISKSSQNVFWCLSMTESTWQFLDAVVRISEHFTYVIETRNLSEDQLEQAVMARHEVSGYGLRFSPENSQSVARRLKKVKDGKDRQRVLREVFFERLSDASKGNVQIALFYWLRSIVEIKDDTVHVDPLRPFRFSYLNQLRVDKVFTLAAILQHGTLTVQEHMAVFRSSEPDSAGVIASLAADNLIQARPGSEGDGEKRFSVNPVMQHPVVDLLRNRHIFY